MVLFGLLSLFKGRKYFKPVVGIVSFGTCFIIIMMLLSMFGMVDYFDPIGDSGDTDNLLYTVLAVGAAILISAFISFLIYQAAWDIGVVVMGIILGFLVGVNIYHIFLYKTHSFPLFVSLAVLGTLAFAYLSVKYASQLLVWGTSFIGAYMVVRGISLVAGYFPSEMTSYDYMNKDMPPQVTWIFFAYIASILFLFAVGAGFQFNEKRKDELGGQEDVYRRAGNEEVNQ